ncbi:hypothetical protein DTL42_15380 [Bremerella cremea]|uniref:Uncharacterized protein n=1 Tax=Bremerella cremea TaxID=1031537 RepID=A0A368KRV1_9BACT|nr:hypothetical protein [Bremerella cremea]RCS46348.1 hypothetical protein DTL42_15380 [Bremerella cremea]
MAELGAGVVASMKLWLLIGVLGVSAGHALLCAVRLRHTDQFPALLACTTAVVLLLTALLLSHFWSDAWRVVAKERGFYESRRPVQRVVTLMGIAVLPLLVGGAAWWLHRGRVAVTGAVVLSFLTLGGALVKVISYHPIDRIMTLKVTTGFSLFDLFLGIGILGLNICLAISGSSKQVI